VIPRRSRLFALALAAIASTTCATAHAETPSERASPTAASSPTAVSRSRVGSLREVVCSLPHEWLLRTWRGWRADRGAEIQLLPREYDFIGSGLPHVGPWPYVQDVPLFWYGPGHVAARGPVSRPVTVAGIAPTQARLLGFDAFHAPDGIPMREVIAPGRTPPRLIVTVVWDAAGMNVLDAWSDDWPYLRSLIPNGTWFDQATVGSSPTSTAQIHATIGTGAFPDHHALVGHRMRIGDRVTTPWIRGPQWIVAPTLADLYDRAMGNRPVVGEVGTVSIHLGMLGHGAMWGGGDRDIATTREVANAETLGAETFEWNLSPLLRQYFRFPAYVNDVRGFDADVRAVDAADGRIDDRWRDNDISQLLRGFDTPARIPYQTRVIEDVVEREGFGADEVPDLLFVNFKEIDYISHVWSVNSPEMRDAVAAQDASLRDLVGFLDRQVGAGRWALVLTADHGSMVPPWVSGGVQLSAMPIVSGIDAAFDGDGDDASVVQAIQPTQMFVDVPELRLNGHTLAEVSRWIMGLSLGDAAAPGVSVPPGRAQDRAFRAAFPSGMMRRLPCLPEARQA
jgi:Type I phosphodiesterase / nucleotide pyrophosphatase